MIDFPTPIDFSSLVEEYEIKKDVIRYIQDFQWQNTEDEIDEQIAAYIEQLQTL